MNPGKPIPTLPSGDPRPPQQVNYAGTIQAQLRSVTKQKCAMKIEGHSGRLCFAAEITLADNDAGRMPIARLVRMIWLTGMMFVVGSSLFGQAPPSSAVQVVHQSWTFRDGAPEAVYALAQTSDGYLWLGGQTGLVRFDGLRFEPFKSPFGEELLSTLVSALFAPSSGGLWVGYGYGGFGFVYEGHVKNYSADEPASGTVKEFAQNPDGTLWAATTSGLWRFDQSSWRPIDSGWNAPVPADHVGFDRAGVLWVIGQHRLFFVRPGHTQFELATNSLPSNDFTLDADGRVVTGPVERKKGVNLNGESLNEYPLFGNNSAVLIDRTNAVWIASHDPLVRIPSSKALSNILKSLGGISHEMYDVRLDDFRSKLVDREGNIWFASPTGLEKFFYSKLKEERFPGATNFAVAVGDDGAIWIGSFNGNIYHIVDEKAVVVQRIGGPVLFAYRGRDGTLWFGASSGLWRLTGRKLVRIDLPPGMAEQARFLQTITQDQNGGTWISFGRHGLYRFADGKWTPYGGHDELPRTGVVIEFTDNTGSVWFGYVKNQLAVLNDVGVRVFDASDGLRVGNIKAIYGRGSEIWVGGEFGLEQVDGGRIRSLSALNEEWFRGITGIVETANGDLWLNGLSGIVHLRHSEISEGLKNPAYRIKGERFGRREGLPGLPRQLSQIPTAIEAADGKLWFSEANGLVWLDPSTAEHPATPAPITIQSVSADDKSYEPVFPVSFPAHTSSIQIYYSAVSLSDPEAIRFRYKLQAHDKDWHEVAMANPVNYRNLPPGSYHFDVAASDTNGVWSDKLATAEFTILPAFYQTTWFRVVCASTFLVLLWGLYRLRLHQLHRQFEVGLEERVGERTRIARELHDTLLQSLHGLMFEFQAARNLFARNREEAVQTLDGAISATEQAIAESRGAIQGLRPELSAQSDLAQLLKAAGQELRAHREADHDAPAFSVIMEGEQQKLVPMIQDEVYRIAREVLRNAFRHARAHQIEVEIRYDESQLRLRIRDDGTGMEPKVLKDSRRAGHWGLPGIRERAQAVGARLDFWSEAEAGTEVELSVPAAIAYEKLRGRIRRKLFRKAGNHEQQS
jgi:signal transduction histidine kinase/ligand-binding sensor domain-containing protein